MRLGRFVCAKRGLRLSRVDGVDLRAIFVRLVPPQQNVRGQAGHFADASDVSDWSP